MTTELGARGALALFLVLAASGSVAGAPPSGADEQTPQRAVERATGRDLLNYPPVWAAQVEHIRLELTIPDMRKPIVQARERMTFAAHEGELRTLTLNEALLSIEAVSAPQHRVTHTVHPESETVEFVFDPPVKSGERVDLDIAYTINEAPEGLVWTLDEPTTKKARFEMVYSQGEPESNRYWFVGPDFPNQRFTSEIIADVPRGYQVCSNGRLIEKRELGAESGQPGLDRFHWSLEKPHAAYLVSIAVGKFDVVDVGSDRLPMPVYAPVGQGDRVRATFSRTAKMVGLFEHVFDEPYAWPKYAQVLASNFAWGGMENTSATTLYDTVVLDKTALLDGDQDDLISHELAHQWFGDLVTCKSWEHVWLNEGFATYCEYLWEEFRESSIGGGHGPGVQGMRSDRDGYDWEVWKGFQDVIEHDEVDAPNQPAMVSKQYRHADDVFDREANPYSKGASILHMLRVRLGDEVFFRAIASYLDKYKLDLAETFNLRREFEQASGTNLQRFFDQWCERPGVPTVQVKMTWDTAAGELVVACEQSQRIDADNPAFEVDTTIAARIPGRGGEITHRLHFDTRSSETRIPLPGTPEYVAVNPRLEMLGTIEVTQPVEWTAAQLTQSPSPGARIQAAFQLAGTQGPDRVRAVEALDSTCKSDSAHRNLRIAALQALAKLANPDPVIDDEKAAKKERPSGPAADPCREAAAVLIRMMDEPPLADARVRKALVEGLARAVERGTDITRERVALMFTSALTSDGSYAVRAAATDGLGRMKTASAVQPVLGALNVESQHDQIRRAAIKALPKLDSPAVFEIAVRFTEPDNAGPTRSEAVGALGKLAGKNVDEAYRRLAQLVTDREMRVRHAAVRALGKVDDERARSLLKQIAEHGPGREIAAIAAEAIEDAEDGETSNP